MSNPTAAGSNESGPKKCIPFVSEYTDCTDENQCSGCTKCICTARGDWSCEIMDKCSIFMERSPLNDDDVESALIMMENELKRDRLNAAAKSKYPLVPPPPTAQELLIVPDNNERKFSIEDELMDLMRSKRSTDDKLFDNDNRTVLFHHTIDEINDDTLNNVNLTGTIQAKKLDVVKQPKLSRRTGLLLNDNSSNSLQIEYNKLKLYQHTVDNKIDSNVQTGNKLDADLRELSGNRTKQQKDKDLSKFIVNELHKGTEVIGDKNAPIISNITFTPENDTLTAVTFIAGNLLNKLWSMERDSSESVEIEMMKHEKIADLLEIFKEPLTIRQESFLKNALQQLSSAIDKNSDESNVSLCDSIKNVTKMNELKLKQKNEHSKERKDSKRAKENAKQKHKKADAVEKINEVIDLVNKFENIRTGINVLKNNPSHSNARSDAVTVNNTKEDYPLNLFGGILDKITKLIMPNTKSKNIINKIRDQNIFSNAKQFEKKLKQVFNVDIHNKTVTVKDKIVLDYLEHIDRNPDCLLKQKAKNMDKKAKSSIEGDILLNLSEFFKIKSLSDLVKLINSETKNDTEKTPKTRASNYVKKESLTTTAPKITTKTLQNRTKTFAETKEKLKTHLQTILEDLMELRTGKSDLNGKENVDIKDILPCIYNIMNSNDKSKLPNGNKFKSNDKITAIFENLKKDLKYSQNTRRSNIISERPKSAIVWDRVIKNIKVKQKLSTRRNLMSITKPKTYEELKKIMEETEFGSNTYKNAALLNEVPPADKLTLLKTFDMDVKKYANALEHIKNSLDSGNLAKSNFREINEYLDNVASNIKLDEKVIKNINKQSPRTDLIYRINKKRWASANKTNNKQTVELDGTAAPYKSNMKVTRDEIVNQLIRNRLTLYLKVKEASDNNFSEDINYDIAKRILLYLDRGNSEIARYMYKIFVSRYETNIVKDGIIETSRTNINNNARHGTMETKVPVIQFDETKVDDVPLISHEHLLRQLFNIKNMKI